MPRTIPLLVAAVLILGAAAAPVAANETESDKPYLVLTMKDRSQVKLEYDESVIPWVTTDILDEFTCKSSHFEMANVAKVFFLGEGWNSCEQKDGWLFDVYFLDDSPPLRGFMEIQAPQVSARCFDDGSGRPVTSDPRPNALKPGSPLVSPLDQVKRISFHRNAR